LFSPRQVGDFSFLLHLPSSGLSLQLDLVSGLESDVMANCEAISGPDPVDRCAENDLTNGVIEKRAHS
jgi:hypothetical protein